MGDHAHSQSQTTPNWSPPNHQPESKLPGVVEQPTATPFQVRPFVLPTPPPAAPPDPPDDIHAKPEQSQRSYIDLTQANFSITPPDPPNPRGGRGHASAAPLRVQAKCDACEAESKSAKDKMTVQTKTIAPSPDFSYLLGPPSPSLQQQPSPPKPKSPAPGDLTMADLMRLAPTAPETVAPVVQRQSEGAAGEASHEVETKIQQTKGSGQRLSNSIREPMEQAFGADFSSVRIHTDGESDALNQALQAKAFTTGQDIYFRDGAYEPESRGGQELLAHELTHVVQQNGPGNQLQMDCGVDECCPEEATPEADADAAPGMTSPEGPMSTAAPTPAGAQQADTAAPQAGMTSGDAPMSVPVPVVTSDPEDNEFDTLVQAELESFLAEFSAIPVTVRWVEQTDTQCVPQETEVTVHPPYFMNVTQGSRPTAAARTVERYDTATGNRGDADRDTRRYLREVRTREDRGGMGMPSAMVGKSSPEEIQTILQTVIDRHLIPTPAGQAHLTGGDLRNWLVQYGIGVDCSAFVAQALNRVMEEVYGRPRTDDETLRRSGRGTRNARSMTGDARSFSEVEADELRPGDTMGIPGHIRIVTSVRQDAEGNTIFTTAEARAGGQADVGPDRAEWRYRNGQLQMRRSPEADWSYVDEAPTFGRYDRLADVEAAQAEEAAATTSTSQPSIESTTEISVRRKEADLTGKSSSDAVKKTLGGWKIQRGMSVNEYSVPSIRRTEFGEQIRLDSLPGYPPRVQLLGPYTDSAVAGELYGDPSIEVNHSSEDYSIVEVSYRRLLDRWKPYFSGIEEEATDEDVDRDAATLRLLELFPQWDVASIIEGEGGLVDTERNLPNAYPVIRQRIVDAYGEEVFDGLYENDVSIMRLIRNAEQITGQLQALMDECFEQEQWDAYDFIEGYIEDYELEYSDAVSLYAQHGQGFILVYSLVLTDPDVTVENIRQRSQDYQGDRESFVEAGQTAVGRTIATREILFWWDDTVTLERVLEPSVGCESQREALVFARIAGKACAVVEVEGRYYIYELNHQYSADDVRATGFHQRTDVVASGGQTRAVITTTDGVILGSRRGGSRHFIEDQTEHAEENLAADTQVLGEHGDSLSYSQGFRLFKEMVRDLALRNLIHSRRELNRELERFFQDGLPPSRMFVDPSSGTELQRDTAALRHHLMEATDLANEIGDSPDEGQIQQLQTTLSAIGEIHSRNAVAALLVINNRDEDETGPAEEDDFEDQVAGQSSGDAAWSGSSELGRRLRNVERIQNYLLEHPDAVLQLTPLHPQILANFPQDQQVNIRLRLGLHTVEQLARTIGVAARDIALAVTGTLVGGPFGLALGGLATGLGVAQTLESFEHISTLEAMTELDLPGEFTLASPEMVSNARMWAGIGVALTLIDIGGFVRSARRMARLRMVLADPELAEILARSRRDFREVAEALNTTEQQLTSQLRSLRGGARTRLLQQMRDALRSRSLQRWQANLSQSSRELLEQNDELGHLYSEMDPRVRQLFTFCSSPCSIVANATRRDVAEVRALIDRLGDVDYAPLRIYFHISDDLPTAIRHLRRVEDLNGLHRQLRQAFRRRAMEPLSTAAPAVSRSSPGAASGGMRLPGVSSGQDWLRGTGGRVGLIPRQIADRLRGRQFNGFDEFRAAFWQEVAADTRLSSDFSPHNVRTMASGSPPGAISSQQHGGQAVYQLHHITPIEHGGGLYDLDNIAIVSPRYHQHIHNLVE